MPTTSTSINGLAAGSLAYIFALLSPDERVRVERVCRKWHQIARKYAWTEFRALKLDWKELVVDWQGPCGMARARDQLGQWAAIKLRELIDRCAPYLREFSFPALSEHNVKVEHWAKMRNLRHLRFNAFVGSEMLRAVVDNLPPLQSIQFREIDWRGIAELHELLRVANKSLQALRLPMTAYLRKSLCLPALPSSLRSLQINADIRGLYPLDEQNYIDELLELAISCCPQLTMLVLPTYSEISRKALTNLAKFDNSHTQTSCFVTKIDRIFYLGLCFYPSDTNIFGTTLAQIGSSLRALLLGEIDSKVLHLVAKHCPLLEHCSFEFDYDSSQQTDEMLLSALQSVFRLAHLRSVSIRYNHTSDQIRTQIMAAINGLKAKGNLEYLHLPWGLPLAAEFIASLIQLNPKLRKLTCTILEDYTPVQLGELKTVLQNRERTLELELADHCLPELNLRENSKVRVGSENFIERISQPMLREFWSRGMDSVPELIDLDD